MTIKDDTLISVRNRNNGITGYVLDNNFQRNFNIGETKQIPFGELKSLSYAAGGDVILNNYLVIENEEALKLLNMNVEPEYFYTEDDIKKLLFEGSIDEFADFLDFAPDGALEIAKTIAVKEQIPDVRKRDMLSKKTGLNINNAIMVNEIMDGEDEKEEDTTPKRRVPVKEEKPSTGERRAAAPQYKVVTKK